MKGWLSLADGNELKVKVIGGHGGVSPGYKATSYLINDHLLIDAGSIASGVSIVDQAKVDHILISHAHLDHIFELAFLCDNCFGMRQNPFQVYSTALVKKAIYDHILNDTIWPDFQSYQMKKIQQLSLMNLRLKKRSSWENIKLHPSE